MAGLRKGISITPSTKARRLCCAYTLYTRSRIHVKSVESQKSQLPVSSMNINLNEALKALDNPTRLNILTLLKHPRENFPEQQADPEERGVCVGIIQERVGLSQSTVSNYLAALQRAQLVTSQRIGPWTYYKRNEEKIALLLKALESAI